MFDIELLEHQSTYKKKVGAGKPGPNSIYADLQAAAPAGKTFQHHKVRIRGCSGFSGKIIVTCLETPICHKFLSKSNEGVQFI
ncbi:MAG: hypothetical protein K9J79_00120 [Desulfobacteraceae bacterium]|nr:hypothetical protein [Desulfobacteraceae bacterium]